MPRSRLTIAGLAFWVLWIAFVLAILRLAVTRTPRAISGHEPLGFVLVTLPLVSALIPGLVRTLGGRGGAFLGGFETFGWLAVLGYAALSWFAPEETSSRWVQPTFGVAWNALAEWSAFDNPLLTDLFMWSVMFPVCSFCLSLPLWPIAFAGGLLFRHGSRTRGEETAGALEGESREQPDRPAST